MEKMALYCYKQPVQCRPLTKKNQHEVLTELAILYPRRGSRGGGGAGAGAHPWDGRKRAEGAGSLVSGAERRDTGVS